MGLQEGLKKGNFPFLFNTKGNENHVGPWPHTDFYVLNSKSEEEGKALCEWYDTVKDKTFNMQREILEYCKNDVFLLAQAAIKFSNLIDEKTDGIQCFLETCTIAACAMQCFRSLYLPENTIPVIPPMGFLYGSHFSKKSLQWMKYMESLDPNVKIRTVVNWGEVPFGKYKLDGYDDQNNTVYGCYWYGHTCIQQLRHYPLDDEQRVTLQNRYEAKKILKQYLKSVV